MVSASAWEPKMAAMSLLPAVRRKEKDWQCNSFLMLNKSNRINKTRELNKLYRSGKTVHSSSLVIKFSANKSFSPASPSNKSRIAFVVSKRVSKKAVERNRIKRVLREEIRKKLNSLLPGDYVLLLKSAAVRLTNAQLRADLVSSLKRGNLWQV